MISLEAINKALGVAKPSNEEKLEEAEAVVLEPEAGLNIFKSFEAIIKKEVLQLKLDLFPRQDCFEELCRQFTGCATLDYNEYTIAAGINVTVSDATTKADNIASSSSSSSFSQVRRVPKQLVKYFTANTFLILPKDKQGRVKTEDLLRFIQKSMEAEEAGLNLLRHCITDDSDNGPSLTPSVGWGVHGVSGDTGFISEAELERYIFELIPSIDSCKSFDFSFYPFYAYAASRKFFFFQDPHRTRQIAIKKLAHCGVMEEFMQVRRRLSAPTPMASFDARQGNSSTTFCLNSSPSSENWFLGTQAEKIYNTYLELDADENGTLSEDELYHFGGMNPSDSLRLTRTAIRRLLEETVTYSPVELDFKGFLDLVLALKNKATPQSITYFWKIINVDKSGRLSEQNIQYFYKEIFTSLKEHGCDAPDVKNVVVEIFDILACQDPRGPSLKDVIKSGQGHVVMSMLLDVTGFWQYDNRESLIGQQQQQQQGGSN